MRIDATNEFVKRANEAIKNMAAQPHNPRELTHVFVPAPRGMKIGNCCGEIHLDNAHISIVKDGNARGKDGKVLFDAGENNADLYLVSGNMKD